MARRSNAFSPCSNRARARLGLLLIGAVALLSVPAEAASFGSAEFEKLLARVAEGWNTNNARPAADCFTLDAIYSEPPEKQLYRGREALFNFFAGSERRKSAMRSTWRHVMFIEKTQVGAGEFTFAYGSLVHGVAVIKVRDGLISNWRE